MTSTHRLSASVDSELVDAGLAAVPPVGPLGPMAASSLIITADRADLRDLAAAAGVPVELIQP